MYLSDLLNNTNVDNEINLSRSFKEGNIEKKYFKHKQKYYQLKRDSIKEPHCGKCEIKNKCKPTTLVNYKIKEYNLVCFESYKIISIEDKKAMFAIELAKDYFILAKIIEPD